MRRELTLQAYFRGNGVVWRTQAAVFALHQARLGEGLNILVNPLAITPASSRQCLDQRGGLRMQRTQQLQSFRCQALTKRRPMSAIVPR